MINLQNVLLQVLYNKDINNYNLLANYQYNQYDIHDYSLKFVYHLLLQNMLDKQYI